MTLLSVRNLSVAIHEKPIVKDISFNLGAGEILALTGESGSGKSISALGCIQFPLLELQRVWSVAFL